MGLGYRYQTSFRHFIGDVEQTQREVLGTQIVNNYHLLDLSISGDLSPRWTVHASLPMLIANRNQLYAPVGFYEVAGQGDATVGARAWLFRPPTESGGNIAMGISLKMPTGRPGATSWAIDRTGKPVIATADQSIQAGDGGYGFALDMQAYHRLTFGSSVYFSGTYLFNPRDINGVATFRTRPGETVMSVADQYLFRGGFASAVPKLRGFTATLGARMEGVPAFDLIGESNGFRRPGYAISIDPGFMYAKGSYLFSCNVPVALYRNRTKSKSDYANNTWGDAAFADYALTFSFSKRF